jgi:hypothetical protein
MAEAEFATGHIKRARELRAAIGEHAPHGPAGALEAGHDDLAQERGGRVVGRQQARQAVR